MKVGILLLARMDASSYPGRPLTTILNRPAIAHQVDRLRSVSAGPLGEIPIIIVTTDRKIDDPLESFAEDRSMAVFRGAPGGDAHRLLTAARKFGLDWVVAVSDSTIVIDPRLVLEAVRIAVEGGVDLVMNYPGGSFPAGMQVGVLRTDFLAEYLAAAPGNGEDLEEALADIRLRTNPVRHRVVPIDGCPGLEALRLALNSRADARLLGFLLRHLDDEKSESLLEQLTRLLEHYHPVQPWVGSHGPLLIAEIGGNHEGDFGYAKALTELAISTRPDFVKFQIYTGDSLVSPVASPDRYKHFQRFELTREQHLELAAMCSSADVGYMASVWDANAFEWVDPFLEIYKIGSGDLDATDMLRQAAGRGKPILLSTGLATEKEVLDAAEILAVENGRYGSPEWLALLQCTSMYPIAPGDANLAVLGRLSELSGLPIGYSDHTEGTAAIYAAVAMGARILEFHFTDRRTGRTFRDHRVSLLQEEVTSLQQYCDEIAVLRGSSRKRPLVIEEDSGHRTSFRRALYPKADLPAGHRIVAADLISLRPCYGISARHLDRVVGMRTLRPLSALAPVQWTDLSED